MVAKSLMLSQNLPERSTDMGTDMGTEAGRRSSAVLPGAVLPGAAALGSSVAVLRAADRAEENDSRALEGAGLPPGTANFLLPSPVAGPSPDSGSVPLNLADLLRQPPLSQSEVSSGRMEKVFACGPAGAVRAQFWRLKAGVDAHGRSPQGGRRAPETTVSEQKRQQRRKDLQGHARESLKRLQRLLADSLPAGSLPAGSLPAGSLPAGGVPFSSPFLSSPLADSDTLVLPEEASAERAVSEYVGRVAAQERAAGAAFWAGCSGVRVPPGAAFEPWLDIKTFTAADCLRHPIEAAGRRWFQASCEKRELERVLGRRAGRATAWAETLKRVRRIQQRFLRASFAWDEYAALTEGHARKGSPIGDDPAPAAAEWLVAWVEATVGEAHLRPLLARSSPGAGPEQLHAHLLREIRGGVSSLGADALPVPAFSLLPAAVARGVRELHTDAGDHFERLKPETQRHLLSLTAPPLDPQAVLLGEEWAALLWAHVQSLPPQQRRALELTAAGLSRREASAAMGCGEESVKEHLSRARRRLRAELQGLG